LENRKGFISLIYQKQMTMKKSKETYRLTHMLPAYTEQQWMESYKEYMMTYYSTPKERRKTHDFEQLIQLMHDIKSFLKSKGHKFF